MNKPQDGNWLQFIPPYDLQFCAQSGVDNEDCLEESLRNLIFMLWSFLASSRVMAFEAGVTLEGSSVNEAINSAMVRYEGLVPNSLWPTPPSPWTWKQYYSPPPQSILSQYVSVNIKLIPPDQNVSPTWTIIKLPSGFQHGVVRVTGTPGSLNGTYCDSEPEGQIKEFGSYGETIVWESGVSIEGVPFVTSEVNGQPTFTPEQFAAFSPQVQSAIHENDNGGHNVIINGQIIPQ